MNYNGFLKHNADVLIIRVVGGGKTPTTAFFFHQTPAMAENNV
jgi:hypothetical protein